MKVVNSKFFLKALPMIALVVGPLFDANAAPRAAVRGTAAARQPVAKANTNTTPVAEPAVVGGVDYEKVETPEIIMNNSTRFDDIVESFTTTSSMGDNALTEMLREQRAKIAALDAAEVGKEKEKRALAGINTCDAGLRKCMSDDKVCGSDFTKCALDGDTIFGDKLNKCRRDTTCTGEEFRLFTTEIKADRDLNVQLSSYNAVINCGNEYMTCIVNECGATFDKCLGKNAADKAINKCKSIATRCKEQDSGLASRFGSVIGKLRETAEGEVKRDEARLYELRDLMRDACQKLGAEFDERSFDCVYSISFFAGKDQSVPMASRKAYPGRIFTCNQELFGIDVTTYKENAYRETRAQTGASSAFLGAGVGTTVGLIASGAIDRAIERTKAEKEVEAAEEESKEANKKDEKKEDKKKDDNKEKKAKDAKQAPKKDNTAKSKPANPPASIEAKSNNTHNVNKHQGMAPKQ